MMIKTKPFVLTPDQLFKLFIVVVFSRAAWIYGVVFLGMAVSAYFQFYYAVIMLAMIPLFTLMHLYTYSRAKETKFFFRQHTAQIDDEFFSAKYDDGSENKIKISNIVKLQKIRQWYILYLTKNQGIFIPKAAFASDDDRKQFEKVFKKK